jgi:NTP pyrophosphatase (non-canonical NTP hydrolase)
MSEELQNLQREIASTLPMVQQLFADYQHKSFVDRPPEFFALELCGEAGELANMEKKRWRGDVTDENATAMEAADVLISLVNFCNARGINLSEAVVQKLSVIQPTKK